MESDSQKKVAAERAVESIESGMIVGLGTGSTALLAVRRISELIKADPNISNTILVVLSSASQRETAARLKEKGFALGLREEIGNPRIYKNFELLANNQKD